MEPFGRQARFCFTVERKTNMRMNLRPSEFHSGLMSVLTGGAPVHDLEGRKIGVIRQPQPHKSYAIVSLGGYLMVGEELRPVPLKKLRYDRTTGIYVCMLEESEIREAPIYTHESNWGESRWSGRVKSYYTPNAA
jgi:hypothetical protein